MPFAGQASPEMHTGSGRLTLSRGSSPTRAALRAPLAAHAASRIASTIRTGSALAYHLIGDVLPFFVAAGRVQQALRYPRAGIEGDARRRRVSGGCARPRGALTLRPWRPGHRLGVGPAAVPLSVYRLLSSLPVCEEGRYVIQDTAAGLSAGPIRI